MTQAIECLQCEKPLFRCEHALDPQTALRTARNKAVKYYRTLPPESKLGRQNKATSEFANSISE